MAVRVVTPPACEPISLQEAKDHLRVDSTADDALIEALISAARQSIDGPLGTLGRCLITQTLELTLPEFPTEIVLPCPPLIAVTSVEYRTGGSPEYDPLTSYQVSRSEPARIKPASSESWPTAVEDTYDAVKVTYTAGYGAHPGAIPAPIRAALLIMVGEMYEHREVSMVGLSVQQMPTLTNLLAPYRFYPV